MSSDIYTNTNEDLEPVIEDLPEKYLLIANSLSEFSTEDQKVAARNVLNLYSKEKVDEKIGEVRTTLEDSIILLQSDLLLHRSATTTAHRFLDAINLAVLNLTNNINQVEDAVDSLDTRVEVLENLNLEEQLSNINSRFDNYYTQSEVRSLCTSLIEGYMDSVISLLIDLKIALHSQANDPHGTYAEVEENFVSKEDLNTITYENVPELTNYILSQIENSKALNYWQTNGPVEATVGLVPEGTDFLDKKLTLQYIMDRIFYGRGILTLIAPEWVIIGSKADLQILIPGNTDAITRIELYQDGTLIKTFTKDDIVKGKIVTKSNQLELPSTLMEVKVYQYTTPEPICAEATIKTGVLAFAGIDYWASFEDHKSWEYLESLVRLGKGNIFVGPEPLTEITTRCSAYDINRNPFELFVVIPKAWGTLDFIQTKSQEFPVDSFTKESWTIYEFNGHIVPYWVYVYKQKIYRCDNLEVTYNISNE